MAELAGELDAERAQRRMSDYLLTHLCAVIRPLNDEAATHPTFEALLQFRDRVQLARRLIAAKGHEAAPILRALVKTMNPPSGGEGTESES